MNNSQFDAQLHAQLDNLNKQIEPQRELWSGIELAITHKSRRTPFLTNLLERLKHWFFAPQMSIAMGVMVIGLLAVMLNEQKVEQQHRSELVSQITVQHQIQKNTLLASFERQPALTVNWQQQVDELDQAAEAIRKALEHEPDNLALLKMLQQVYQQQIELIEVVHAPQWTQV